MANRWTLIPMADNPQGPSSQHTNETYEGDEDGLSTRLSDLQAQTGTPYRAEEWDGEAEPEHDAEAQDAVKAKQDEAEEKGRPVPN